MASLHDNDDIKPTKEEIFRDFLVFWFNHRGDEKLFRHDFFMDNVAKAYAISRADLNSMKDVEQLILMHPLSQFVDVLRLCYTLLQGREAKLDMNALISYAKEGF